MTPLPTEAGMIPARPMVGKMDNFCWTVAGTKPATVYKNASPPQICKCSSYFLSIPLNLVAIRCLLHVTAKPTFKPSL